MVRKYKEKIIELSDLLLDKKTIDINDITSVLGHREGSQLKEYIYSKNQSN